LTDSWSWDSDGLVMSNEAKAPLSFWADDIAANWSTQKNTYVAMTGITPSGHIHVGNMREVVTADAVVRALKALGKTAKFYYVADTFDPLRKVYPFLDEKTYAPFVGQPLSEIPAPDGSGQSYADYFLTPFLESLQTLDIQVSLIRADQAYKEDKYVENIIKALQATQTIKEILKKQTGKVMDEHWSPFVPMCEKTKSMMGNRVLGFDVDKQTVGYVNAQGYESEVPMAGGGKLTWRLDWPARWQIFGVTFEPFGKDHASRGGSFDTAKRFVRDIFDYEIPCSAVYEWVSLTGGGDMSSSKGNVISIAQMTKVMPPEVLKYCVVRAKPNKRLTFDPGLPMLSLVDEFDDLSSKSRHERAAELSAVSDLPPLGVPFKHIISLAQITGGDLEIIQKILKRNGYQEPNLQTLQNRLSYAQAWLEAFAPDDIKFSIAQDLPSEVGALTSSQRQGLGLLAQRLKPEMDASQTHEILYGLKDELQLTPKEIFEAVYIAILGKAKGPRAGFFLASLEHAFVKERFEQAAAVSNQT